MKTLIVRVHTGHRDDVHDITRQCAEFAEEAAGGGDGLLHVFVPHATAGVALMELGSGSDADLLAALGELRLVPTAVDDHLEGLIAAYLREA